MMENNHVKLKLSGPNRVSVDSINSVFEDIGPDSNSLGSSL